MTTYQGSLFVANLFNNGALSFGVIFRKPEEWNNGNGLNFQDTDSTNGYCDDYEQKMFIYATEAQEDSSDNEIKMRNSNFSFQQLINETEL